MLILVIGLAVMSDTRATRSYLVQAEVLIGVQQMGVPLMRDNCARAMLIPQAASGAAIIVKTVDPQHPARVILVVGDCE